jgi:hypothetical protein
MVQYPILTELHAQLVFMRDAALISQEEFDRVVRGFQQWLRRNMGSMTMADVT